MPPEIRQATPVEEWGFVGKKEHKTKKPQPEKSKYYDIWCAVEEILLDKRDVILDFTNNHDSEYSLTRVQNGLLKLAKTLRKMHRIDFKIRTETVYVLEPANEELSDVKGEYLQIRATFKDKS